MNELLFPKLVRRSDLELKLEMVPLHPNAKPELEQYRTPPVIAAALLWEAFQAGRIKDKAVLDLGCGTGMFARGAVLLGAATVCGIDIDETCIEIAKEVVGESDSISFYCSDISMVEQEEVGEFDTIVMNPPFGAQKRNRNGDRAFYEAAKRLAPEGECWFLAPTKNQKFLASFGKDLGWTLERVQTHAYPLAPQFEFHQEKVRVIEVATFRYHS